MTNEELIEYFERHTLAYAVAAANSKEEIDADAKGEEAKAELLRCLGAAVSAPPQPKMWFPIETAPKDGRHIQAADFTPGKTGFGGNPQQSFQCVVHWWEWCDGTHREEWGWYPSTGAGESDALTTLTHWKPLEEFFAAAPAQEPRLMITRSGEIHAWCPDCRGDCCSPYKVAQEQPYSRPECHMKACESPEECKRKGICKFHYREARAQEQPVEPK